MLTVILVMVVEFSNSFGPNQTFNPLHKYKNITLDMRIWPY